MMKKYQAKDIFTNNERIFFLLQWGETNNVFFYRWPNPYSNKLGLEQPGKVKVIGEFCFGADQSPNPVSQGFTDGPARGHVLSLP